MGSSVFQNIIVTPDAPVEDLKNRVVAALFSGKTKQLKTLLDQTTGWAKPAELGETDEKYLRQVLTALIRHKHLVDDHPDLKKQTKKLKHLLADKLHNADPGHMAYDTWKKRLDLAPWQNPYIFSEAITFQMTSG
ncbi:MAG: hypothetical protein KBE30_03655, partial [Desulfobacter sp.]|nr:hypothetical protein [Desulfobacter sp.]